MEALVLALVIAAFTQRVVADWWAGVTGKEFPSQRYRQKRLELQAARRLAAGQESPRSRPARDYVAGTWALAWDTMGRRREVKWTERQDRWERKRSGDHVSDGKPRPARSFLGFWWHTGPAQWWQNAWTNAQQRRQRKVESSGDPHDSEPSQEPIAEASNEVETSEEPAAPDGPVPAAEQPTEPVSNTEQNEEESVPATNTTPSGNGAGMNGATEAVGLSSAIAFAQQWASSAQKAAAGGADHATYANDQAQAATLAVVSIENVSAAVQQSGTTGAAVTSFAEAQQHLSEAKSAYEAAAALITKGAEEFQAASAALTTAHTELSSHLPVKDSYQAAPEAGRKEWALAE